MSNRNTILDAFKEMCGDITKGHGFNNTVKVIERKFLFWDTIQVFPVLMVLGGDENFENVMGGSIASYMDVLIKGYTKNKVEPEVEMCSLIEDVMNILDNPAYNTFHGKCNIISLRTDEGWLSIESEGIGMFEIKLRIVYEFQWGSA